MFNFNKKKYFLVLVFNFENELLSRFVLFSSAIRITNITFKFKIKWKLIHLTSLHLLTY